MHSNERGFVDITTSTYLSTCVRPSYAPLLSLPSLLVTQTQRLLQHPHKPCPVKLLVVFRQRLQRSERLLHSLGGCLTGHQVPVAIQVLARIHMGPLQVSPKHIDTHRKPTTLYAMVPHGGDEQHLPRVEEQLETVGGVEFRKSRGGCVHVGDLGRGAALGVEKCFLTRGPQYDALGAGDLHQQVVHNVVMGPQLQAI